MATPTRVKRQSAYEGCERFRVYDYTGEKGDYLEGAYPIRDYMVDMARWGLARRSNRLAQQHISSFTPSPTPSPPAKNTRKRTPTPEAPSSPPKRQRRTPSPDAQPVLPNGQTPTYPSDPALPAEALNILRPPTSAQSPEYDCLACGKPANDTTCTLSCYATYRRTVLDPVRTKLQIRQTAPGTKLSAGIGLGVFVRPGHTIRAGTFLGEYLGEILPADAPEGNTSAYAFTMAGDDGDGGGGGGGGPELLVDAETHGNWTRFVNSSCRPNVEALPEQVGKVRVVVFRALRNIKAGEQLFIFYGQGYFETRGLLCCCGEQPVAHTVVADDVVGNGGRARRGKKRGRG